VGEHGDSEVLIWSSLDVGGRPLQEFAEAMGRPWTTEDRTSTEDEVVNAAYRIIQGKGATYYGVAAAIARAVEVVIRDRRSILTVSAWSPRTGAPCPAAPRVWCRRRREMGYRSTRTSASGSSAPRPCSASERPPSASPRVPRAGRTAEPPFDAAAKPQVAWGVGRPGRLFHG